MISEDESIGPIRTGWKQLWWRRLGKKNIKSLRIPCVKTKPAHLDSLQFLWSLSYPANDFPCQGKQHEEKSTQQILQSLLLLKFLFLPDFPIPHSEEHRQKSLPPPAFFFSIKGFLLLFFHSTFYIPPQWHFLNWSPISSSSSLLFLHRDRTVHFPLVVPSSSKVSGMQLSKWMFAEQLNYQWQAICVLESCNTWLCKGDSWRPGVGVGTPVHSSYHCSVCVLKNNLF